MGLWNWLFGTVACERGVLVGDGEFGFHVVGTSHHQDAISDLCGGKTREGVHRYCAALVAPEPTNPYDRHAVAVRIHGIEVGYLERDVNRDFLKALHAAGYADAACEALINGGWDRGGHNQGYFGVHLNAFLPFRLYSANDWHRANGAAH